MLTTKVALDHAVEILKEVYKYDFVQPNNNLTNDYEEAWTDVFGYFDPISANLGVMYVFVVDYVNRKINCVNDEEAKEQIMFYVELILDDLYNNYKRTHTYHLI